MGPEVGNVYNVFSLKEDIDRRSRIFAHIEHRIAAQIDVAFLTVNRNGSKDISLSQKQVAVFGLTNASCISQHRIKDRLKVAWRGADNFENLGRRSLLFQ